MVREEKFKKICEIIEKELDAGYCKFAIYPFGENGMWVKNILKDRYGVDQVLILDNKLCRYRTDVFNLSEIDKMNLDDISILITVENPVIYDEVISVFQHWIKNKHFVKIFSEPRLKKQPQCKKTIIGKYSGGSAIASGNHPFIKSIGAFSSFAEGVEVVPNHPMNYISTHTFLYGANRSGETEYEEPFTYDMFSDFPWFFPGVIPQGACYAKRITIGNDVWLGRNVIITNYANIGDGVIAGAGSVITKDVPDFAVVVGAPARIIKYRFSKEQIIALKKIAWWNWEDEKIRNNYDDFFLPVDQFIKKHI